MVAIEMGRPLPWAQQFKQTIPMMKSSLSTNSRSVLMHGETQRIVQHEC
jgi:hypothetical protein